MTDRPGLPRVAAAVLLAAAAIAAVAFVRSGPAPVGAGTAAAEAPQPPAGAIADRATPQARRLAQAAATQVGRTVRYDPAYERLAYPGGDVPIERGVCTDVVIRAMRELDVDLQVLVHEDMSRAFRAYPTRWGLSRPDPNIDHRRVPNLRVLFERRGLSLPVGTDPATFQPGDFVTWEYGPNRLPHIGIVSVERSADGRRFCVVHNMGRGTQVEDVLFEPWMGRMTGHYRWFR